MSRSASIIAFEARLLRPASPGRGDRWSFLILPKPASARLPTRGMTSVEGTINDHPFRATLEPDGQRSHWLKVSSKLREAAGIQEGELVALEINPAAKQPESRLPSDLRRALAAAPEAHALWAEITPAARRDWIQWISTAKRAETRARRIDNACDMLAKGKRRVCCFDRSGVFSGGLRAPEAAELASRRVLQDPGSGDRND